MGKLIIDRDTQAQMALRRWIDYSSGRYRVSPIPAIQSESTGSY
jgi:hypothetical protein